MSEKKLTKADLIEHLTTGMNMGKTQAEMTIGIIFREMERKLQQGCTVSIPGIGTLTPFTTEPKKGRNPRTGEPMTYPACKVPVFKPGKALKDAIR